MTTVRVDKCVSYVVIRSAGSMQCCMQECYLFREVLTAPLFHGSLPGIISFTEIAHPSFEGISVLLVMLWYQKSVTLQFYNDSLITISAEDAK